MTHPCIHRWSTEHKGQTFVLHFGVREDGKYVLLEKIVYHSAPTGSGAWLSGTYSRRRGVMCVG